MQRNPAAYNEEKTEGQRAMRRRLIGYSFFGMAAGIAIGMILSDPFWCIVLILALLLTGYNLLCC